MAIVYDRSELEYLRMQAKDRFTKVRSTWIDCGQWAAPHRIQRLQSGSQNEGERVNYHIVDPSHLLALRSYVAGFLEGNTSASRPWYRISARDPKLNDVPANRAWLELFTRRTLECLGSSNFYTSAGQFYYDYGCFNTGAHFIDEIRGSLFFHNLVPGDYYVLNNGFGEAVVLVREFSLTVKALVDTYGKKKNGNWDWSNFSSSVKKMYDEGNYTTLIDVCQVVRENDEWDASKPQALLNKKWISWTYEMGTNRDSAGYANGVQSNPYGSADLESRYLSVSASKRKPFIIGKSETSGNFEYGQKGPTLDALGLIKSLNKKAIAQDVAIEKLLEPAVQGPSNLRKQYISTQSRAFVPLDPTSAKPGGGLRPIYEVNGQGLAALAQNVMDMRSQVGKIYYSDYLLFLSQNPKTRTATETNAVVQEQQLVIGPNLQALNWTYNVPVVEFVMDFVLDEDPFLPPPPPGLAGTFLTTEFISVFAQAQRAADLPAIERYTAMVEQVGQLPGGEAIWQKINLDKLADLYEDRLYLPEGLNNPQSKVDAMRQQAAAQQQKQQQMEQALQASQAAKNVGIQAPQQAPQ